MRKKNHILDALESIAEAQKELNQRVNVHDKILESQGKNIATLEKQVLELRNQAIKAEISSGERTDSVANKYGVSSARVSQIAPRNKTHRPKPN